MGDSFFRKSFISEWGLFVEPPLNFFTEAFQEAVENPDALSSLQCNLNGRYTEEEFIAEGGLKKIYQVLDNVTGRLVARAYPKSSKRELCDLFISEARVQSLLEHPNIIPIYDSHMLVTNPVSLAPLFICGKGAKHPSGFIDLDLSIIPDECRSRIQPYIYRSRPRLRIQGLGSRRGDARRFWSAGRRRPPSRKERPRPRTRRPSRRRAGGPACARAATSFSCPLHISFAIPTEV